MGVVWVAAGVELHPAPHAKQGMRTTSTSRMISSQARAATMLPLLLLIAALAALAAPVQCTELNRADRAENFLGTDDAGNLAMFARNGKDVSSMDLLLPTRAMPGQY